jgi:ABC-type lipoprotein export system ATPase subunit
MLLTKNVTFSYVESQVFTMPDLACNSGEILLITGDSGKGKTTYLHLLAGLLSPKSGSILINNQDISILTEKNKDRFRGKNIGLIFQKSNFLAAFSALENVEMASWLATGKKNTSKAVELFKRLGIEDQMHKKTSQLSIGQQQRVSIIRALINSPKIVLADEPTSSLDDLNTQVVINLLVDLAKEFGTALVIVTHDSRLKDRFNNQIVLS